MNFRVLRKTITFIFICTYWYTFNWSCVWFITVRYHNRYVINFIFRFCHGTLHQLTWRPFRESWRTVRIPLYHGIVYRVQQLYTCPQRNLYHSESDALLFRDDFWNLPHSNGTGSAEKIYFIVSVTMLKNIMTRVHYLKFRNKMCGFYWDCLQKYLHTIFDLKYFHHIGWKRGNIISTAILAVARSKMFFYKSESVCTYNFDKFFFSSVRVLPFSREYKNVCVAVYEIIYTR